MSFEANVTQNPDACVAPSPYWFDPAYPVEGVGYSQFVEPNPTYDLGDIELRILEVMLREEMLAHLNQPGVVTQQPPCPPGQRRNFFSRQCEQIPRVVPVCRNGRAPIGGTNGYICPPPPQRPCVNCREASTTSPKMENKANLGLKNNFRKA